jgi:hypothetical protein
VGDFFAYAFVTMIGWTHDFPDVDWKLFFGLSGFLPDGRMVLVLTKGDRLPLRDKQNAAATNAVLAPGTWRLFYLMHAGGGAHMPPAKSFCDDTFFFVRVLDDFEILVDEGGA